MAKIAAGSSSQSGQGNVDGTSDGSSHHHRHHHHHHSSSSSQSHYGKFLAKLLFFCRSIKIDFLKNI